MVNYIDISHWFLFFKHKTLNTHCTARNTTCKLHWTEPPMRMCRKTTNSPFINNVKSRNKISQQNSNAISMHFLTLSYNTMFNATQFTCLSIQKGWTLPCSPPPPPPTQMHKGANVCSYFLRKGRLTSFRKIPKKAWGSFFVFFFFVCCNYQWLPMVTNTRDRGYILFPEIGGFMWWGMSIGTP